MQYMNDINSLFNMEGEIGKMRYMRKMENSTINASINSTMNASKHKLSISYNNGYQANASVAQNKTPNKNPADTKSKKTPNGKSSKSPGKFNVFCLANFYSLLFVSF